MTNREEYIEQQLHNIDLATLIVHRIDRCAFCNKKDCKFVCQPLEYKNLEFCITHIKEWLSQETEEDKKTCGNCKFHKKVEPCIGAIDKKCVNPKSESCGTYTPVEKSADEMFEELGYIKEGKFSGCIAYWCDKYKKRITIIWNDEEDAV